MDIISHPGGLTRTEPDGKHCLGDWGSRVRISPLRPILRPFSAGAFYRAFYNGVRIPFGVPICDGMTALTEAQRQEPHRVAARLRITNAVGFMKAADALWAQHKNNDELFHPFVFFVNLCFAYEISLKAFLAHRKWGGDEKRDIGHDLEKALAEAVTLGYQPPADVADTIKILSPLSKSMELRYLRQVSVHLPDPPDHALKVAQAHIRAIGDQLPIADLK